MKLNDFIKAVQDCGYHHEICDIEFVGLIQGEEVHPSSNGCPIEFIGAKTITAHKISVRFITTKPHYEETIH